jgi:hypothetical protein
VMTSMPAASPRTALTRWRKEIIHEHATWSDRHLHDDAPCSAPRGRGRTPRSPVVLQDHRRSTDQRGGRHDRRPAAALHPTRLRW